MKPKLVAFATNAAGESPITAESTLYGRRVLKTIVKRLCRQHGLTEVGVSAYEERGPGAWRASSRRFNPPPIRRAVAREYRRQLIRGDIPADWGVGDFIAGQKLPDPLPGWPQG